MSVVRNGDTVIKTDYERPSSTRLEALGLRWLGQAQEHGGAHVVAPIGQPEDGILRTHALRSHPCDASAARRFGSALALTHAAGAAGFGHQPPGWESDGWVGMAPLSYLPSTARWGEFYAQERLLPYLPSALDNGSIDAAGASIIERLCERLREGDFDSAQPQLVHTPAARIHGDLWNGNIIWDQPENLPWAPGNAGTGGLDQPLPPLVGVLIDPAAQGGHAETDLATLGIFGQPHWEEIYAGYNEVSTLASGWQERVGLHQLHILLVHAYLFAGGYGSETVALARSYVG